MSSSIPTPEDIEARLSSTNTGLRDRVIGVLDGAKSLKDFAVKIGNASEAEVKRVTAELEKSWRVTKGEVQGAPALILAPKTADAPSK